MFTAYKKIIVSLKKRENGSTAADVAAATALSLSVVNELLPKAADEFSGHLRVTESGEILYHFPDGFTSRYRSFGAKLKRAGAKLSAFFGKALVLLFKIWIMVMLIGYFILFLLIALAVVFLSIAARTGSSDKGGGGGGGFLGFRLFDILWRIWFYSEISRSVNDSYDYEKIEKKRKNPMHKAIFSFVFGEENPNLYWEDQKTKAVISYIQSNSGVISLCEYMAFCGLDSMGAEKEILNFCSKFEGSPEVTQEGAIVYRFDKLLLRADNKKFKELIAPVKRLKIFSINTKSKNAAFALINGFNLACGTYFLYLSSALNQMTVFLGLIPFVFSILFWLIPVIRFIREKKENENNKLENFKRFSFNRIWNSPKNIDKFSFYTEVSEFKVRDAQKAAERAIKDISVISMPDIEIDEGGIEKYSFNELEKEKQSLENYRSSIDLSKLRIGDTVFDSRD